MVRGNESCSPTSGDPKLRKAAVSIMSPISYTFPNRCFHILGIQQHFKELTYEAAQSEKASDLRTLPHRQARFGLIKNSLLLEQGELFISAHLPSPLAANFLQGLVGGVVGKMRC